MNQQTEKERKGKINLKRREIMRKKTNLNRGEREGSIKKGERKINIYWIRKRSECREVGREN